MLCSPTALGRVNTGEGVGETAREVGSPFNEPCHPLSGDWLYSELDMGLLSRFEQRSAMTSLLKVEAGRLVRGLLLWSKQKMGGVD